MIISDVPDKSAKRADWETAYTFVNNSMWVGEDGDRTRRICNDGPLLGVLAFELQDHSYSSLMAHASVEIDDLIRQPICHLHNPVVR